jgi:formylglycine-generating enzyme required for sulfatase activity
MRRSPGRVALLATAVLASCGGRAVTASEQVPSDAVIAPDGGSSPDAVLPGSWITIAAGSFLMGSPTTEPCRQANEELHPVQLTHALSVASSEVTQGDFQARMGFNPSKHATCGADCPVDSPTWHDAVVFCNRLSEKLGLDKCYSCVADNGTAKFPFDCTVRTDFDGSTGKKRIYDCPGFRLPTEAEWEHAYRAGTTSALPNGPIASCLADPRADAIGWYMPNADERPHPVASKLPNAWGLYDMAGNVMEWVNDHYQPDLGSTQAVDPVGPASGSSRVVRGGSFQSGAWSTRAASRNQNLTWNAQPHIGFRCVRSLL